MRQNILEVALDYLSCGLDPAQSTLFIQSRVPESMRAGFLLHDLVTVARLQRNPTVKAEIQLRGFAEGNEEEIAAPGYSGRILHLPDQPGLGYHRFQGHDSTGRRIKGNR